jgi:hypothetical protein
MNRLSRFVLLCLALTATLHSALAVGPSLNLIGQFHTGIFDQGACEISAYDAATQRLFVVSASAASLLVLDMSDPTNPTQLFTLSAAAYGGNEINSVAVRNGVVAACAEANPKTDPGVIVFWDNNGNYLAHYPAGALPDMITFTPDGNYVLSANEGEPNDDYTVDPEGTVTIVNISGGIAGASVATASFTNYIGQEVALRAQGIRIFGPGANAAMDFEPEYIAINSSSSTAFVTLQENNAIAVIDIAGATVTALNPLGFKNHNLPGNKLDASNQDGAINLQNWPVYGMYLPDGIASYEVNGQTYLVTANEGDTREYTGTPGFVEFGRLRSFITLDPTVFPNAATLRNNVNLGRLNVTRTLGNPDNDGDFDEIYCFGGRSFSIWDENGNQVFDSGDDFETRIASMFPTEFNSNNDANQSFDSRSDDKGPEPESVVIADYCGRKFAFIGLERVGGIMIYDVTDPANSYYVDYVTSRDFSVIVDENNPATLAAAVELGPEGLLWISAADSPNGQPLLVCSNEINGSVTIYSAVCDEILPVEFGSFEAVAGDRSVSLYWNTLTETDNDHFELFRDNMKIATIDSRGNSADGAVYSWMDRTVENSVRYTYSLVSVSVNGERDELASASATPSATNGLPLEFALNPAYPNPFNPNTTLSYSIPEAAHVKLQVFDNTGREVATLVNEMINSGTHTLNFDANSLPSGLYIARLTAGTFSASQKLVLMK